MSDRAGSAVLVCIDPEKPDERGAMWEGPFGERPGDEHHTHPIARAWALWESIRGDWPGMQATVIANKRARNLAAAHRMELLGFDYSESLNAFENEGGVRVPSSSDRMDTATAPRSRTYAMTRLRRGDYLLPSNDLQTLWRIYTYEENGSLVEVLPDGSDRVVSGTFWACARRPMPKAGEAIDLDGWGEDEWEFWAGPLPTRSDAIDEALRADAAKDSSR